MLQKPLIHSYDSRFIINEVVLPLSSPNSKYLSIMGPDLRNANILIILLWVPLEQLLEKISLNWKVCANQSWNFEIICIWIEFLIWLILLIYFSGPIERQNVRLAQSIFDESTINGLKFYGERGNKDFLQTAEFLETILSWWKIVNVKTCFHSVRKRDHLREEIKAENLVEKTSFLRGFFDWLQTWEEKLDFQKLDFRLRLSNVHSIQVQHLLNCPNT